MPLSTDTAMYHCLTATLEALSFLIYSKVLVLSILIVYSWKKSALDAFQIHVCHQYGVSVMAFTIAQKFSIGVSSCT